MDNRINEIHRKISSLRAGMLALEGSIRIQINRDEDCTELALRVMAMRAEMVGLLEQRRTAGGNDRFLTVEERLKVNSRSPEKQRNASRRVILRR